MLDRRNEDIDLSAVDVYEVDLETEAANVDRNFKKVKGKHVDAKLTDVGQFMRENYDFTKNFVFRNGSELLWVNITFFALVHVAVVYSHYLVFTEGLYATWIFTWLLAFVLGVGLTAGAHRLYTHRSYKAKWPLRLFLVLTHTSLGMKDMHNWVRDHRVHHKFSETDADPHNSKRGWFFAHMGWLMVTKHPDVRLKGQAIDCSDVFDDPIAKFQIKYYIPLFLLFSGILPMSVPMIFWGESFKNAFLVAFVQRWILCNHYTWFVNSAAHVLGDRPYDQKIAPAENVWVSFFGMGEGWHNYHHTFPWDYSTSELSYHVNLTTMFIDWMAHIGQAYALKRVDPEIVAQRKLKTMMTNLDENANILVKGQGY